MPFFSAEQSKLSLAKVVLYIVYHSVSYCTKFSLKYALSLGFVTMPLLFNRYDIQKI